MIKHYDERQKLMLYDCGNQGFMAIAIMLTLLWMLQLAGFHFQHAAYIPYCVLLFSITWFGVRLLHYDILFPFSYEQQPQRYQGILLLCALLSVVFAFFAIQSPFPIDWESKYVLDGCIYYLAALLFLSYTITLSINIKKIRTMKGEHEDA